MSLEAGRVALALTTTDVVRCIAETVDSFQFAASEKGVLLTLHAPSAPVLLTFDGDRLFQVLGNLLGYALKFTPADGLVAVQVEEEETQLHVRVRDTGSGIAADRLETVFERFHQVERPDRRGWGLGLHIARGLVEAHGRRIWVQSVPGAGSTFHFTLPAGAEQGPGHERPAR